MTLTESPGCTEMSGAVNAPRSLAVPALWQPNSEQARRPRRETERREGGTDRKVYRLTEAGLEELRRWIVRPVERRPVRDELLLKLFFGRHVGAEHLRATVEQMRGEQERALGALRVAEGEISEEREHPDFPYWMMTLRFGLDMGEAYLRWCDETLAELRALERVEEGSKR